MGVKTSLSLNVEVHRKKINILVKEILSNPTGSKDYEEYDPDEIVGTRCIHCAITNCPDGQTLQNGDCYDIVTLDEVEPVITSEPVRPFKPVRPSEPVSASKPDETPRSLSSASIIGLETRIIWTTVFVQMMIFL